MRDIWAERQSEQEKEGRERKLETDRQTDRERERYMTPLALTMALHVVPSLAGEPLESGMWNVGFQAWK